jgi:hypothetical protein
MNGPPPRAYVDGDFWQPEESVAQRLRGNTYFAVCHNFVRPTLCASCSLSHLRADVM